VTRASDRDEVLEIRPRVGDDRMRAVPVPGTQPGFPDGCQNIAPAAVRAPPHFRGHRLKLLSAERPGITGRKCLAKAELSLCHALGRETAGLQRKIRQAQAQSRVRQLPGGHRLLRIRFGHRGHCRLPGLGIERKRFGLCQRERQVLLCAGRLYQ